MLSKLKLHYSLEFSLSGMQPNFGKKATLKKKELANSNNSLAYTLLLNILGMKFGADEF